MNHIQLGRIAGIPIYLDGMFVLILMLFCYPYFTSGDTQLMSAGVIIIAGLMLSILLHELGHALAARLFKISVSHVELTALGGAAHFERSLPASVPIRTVVFLAGPAVNLLLWLGFNFLAAQPAVAASGRLALALAVLASANFWLACFNLLPAFPLDGGQTLDTWLSRLLGSRWSIRIVSGLGFLIAIWLGLTSFPNNYWRMFLAFFLFQSNWLALQSVGGWGRGK